MTTSSKSARSSSETTAIETILHKIDRIEEGQGETIRRLDSLHTAIYEPDEGLFARIKANDVAAKRRAVELDQKYTVLTAQLTQTKESATHDGEKLKKLDESTSKVDDLVKWKANVNNALVWLLGAVMLGIGGMLMKLILGWLQGHIKIV